MASELEKVIEELQLVMGAKLRSKVTINVSEDPEQKNDYLLACYWENLVCGANLPKKFTGDDISRVQKRLTNAFIRKVILDKTNTTH